MLKNHKQFSWCQLSIRWTVHRSSCQAIVPQACLYAPLIGLSCERSETVRYRSRNSVTVVINDIIIGILRPMQKCLRYHGEFGDCYSNHFYLWRSGKKCCVYEARKFILSMLHRQRWILQQQSNSKSLGEQMKQRFDSKLNEYIKDLDQKPRSK